jgi:roadblock/LC7 domain-containing protein
MMARFTVTNKAKADLKEIGYSDLMVETFKPVMTWFKSEACGISIQ